MPVGTPLAQVIVEGAVRSGTTALPAAPAIASAVPPVSALPVAPKIPAPPAGAAGAIAGLRASPAARRLAQSHGIDLATIVGSGPDGAIVHADVERILGAPAVPAEKKRATGLDLDAMRKAIAAAMARSKREIPHYYLAHQVDVTTMRAMADAHECDPAA